MDNRKQQPFYVGDRVICINSIPSSFTDPSLPPIKKGSVYIVESCFKGLFSGIWYVGLRGFPWEYGISGSHASRFAPYDPPAIEIPAELLEVDVKDGIDVKPVKELI